MGDLAMSGGSRAALHSQLQKLQQQCADWQGCSTTSSSDKQRIVGELRAQINQVQSELQSQVENELQSQGEIQNRSAPPAAIPGDGINRPIQGLGAGGIINLSV